MYMDIKYIMGMVMVRDGVVADAMAMAIICE